MSKNYKFSVVTISFNQAAFLEQALDSVLSQEGVEIEYIVVDAGSTDGSRDIIDRYRTKIAHVIFEPDDGPADGLNKGLSKATGEYFCYLNSDDRLAPNALREAVDEFYGDPSVDVVYGNGFIIDELNRVVKKVYSDQFPTPLSYVLGVSVFVQQSCFFRTEAVRSVGGFNVRNRGSWDGELMFDLMRSGKRLKRVWRFWSDFRIYDGSITGSDRLRSIIRDNRERLTANFSALRPLFPLLKPMLYVFSRGADWRQIRDRWRRQG